MGGAAQIVQTTFSARRSTNPATARLLTGAAFQSARPKTPISTSRHPHRRGQPGHRRQPIRYCRLTANDRSFVAEQQRVRDSRIDAASFVATTTGISVGDAMAGRLAFTRPPASSTASIVNRGRITVKEGGLAALVAPGVVNDGVIRARLGKAVLAAGETFTLDLAGDRLVNFAVDGQVLRRVTAPDGTPLSAARQHRPDIGGRRHHRDQRRRRKRRYRPRDQHDGNR